MCSVVLLHYLFSNNCDVFLAWLKSSAVKNIHSTNSYCTRFAFRLFLYLYFCKTFFLQTLKSWYSKGRTFSAAKSDNKWWLCDGGNIPYFIFMKKRETPQKTPKKPRFNHSMTKLNQNNCSFICIFFIPLLLMFSVSAYFTRHSWVASPSPHFHYLLWSQNNEIFNIWFFFYLISVLVSIVIKGTRLKIVAFD